MSESNRARRFAIAGALLALAVVALWWWLLRDTDARATAGPEVDGPRSAGPVAVPPGSVPLPTSPRTLPLPASAGSEPDQPIIDRVGLEKESVCEGEENLVTVFAHTTSERDDAYLHATIGGQPGMSVPLRSYRDKDGSEPEPRLITVFGRNNTATTVEVPPFELRDCMVDRKLTVELRSLANLNDVFEFSVRIVDLSATTSFEPVRYRWSFGDGTTETTDQPWAIHDYGRRPQETLYASMVVAVTAEDAAGNELTGRASVALMNHAFSNLVYAGIITIVADLTPRFPEIDDAGVVSQGAFLWHHRPDPIEVEKVYERRNYTQQREPVIREVPVTRLLGATSIPPAGRRVEVRLDTRDEPDLFSIDYLLEGVSAEGAPARGVFSVMRPSPKPTPENSAPVLDPVLEAKIRKARELLAQEIVTDEDLWRLERDGAFDDLVVPERDPNRPPPTVADMPPGPSRAGMPPPDTPLLPGKKLPVMGLDESTAKRGQSGGDSEGGGR